MSRVNATLSQNPSAGRLTLRILLMIWVGSLFGSFSTTGDLATWGRMASSAALVLAGWAWFSVIAELGLTPAKSAAARRYTFCIAMGMFFGFIGDLCNAGIIPLPNQTMGGIAAFGIGHVFYITGCLGLGNFLKLDRPLPRYGSIVFWLVIGTIGWYGVTYSLPEWNIVHWAALPYSLLLAGTVGCAMGLMVQDRSFAVLFVGAAMFFFSDLVLAFRLFHGNFNLAGLFVWILYGPGQMLIVYSTGLALARLRDRD